MKGSIFMLFPLRSPHIGCKQFTFDVPLSLLTFDVPLSLFTFISCSSKPFLARDGTSIYFWGCRMVCSAKFLWVWDGLPWKFLGVSDGLPCKIFICDFFLVAVVNQLVLGPGSCIERIHCTAVFALRNGKFSMWGMFYPYTPLNFRSCSLLVL